MQTIQKRGNMAATVKKKQRSKAQTRIYEHTENLEPVATKEFVRQELRPIVESQGWTRAAFVILFAAVGGLYILLWEFKTDIHNLDQKMDKRMDSLDQKMDKRMDGLEQRMGKIEGKLDILIRQRR